MNTLVNSQSMQPTLFNVLKRRSIFFFAGGLISAAIAVGIAFMIPKQWPATLLIQIGQVGGAANLLTDPNSVIQRIKFPGFVNQVLQSQNLPIDESISTQTALIKKSLNATIAKQGYLIEMTVKGHSPDEAKEKLMAAFRLLQNEHAQLLTPSIVRLKKNLEDARSSLKKIDDERQAILDPINRAKTSNNIERKFSESILLTSMLKSNDSEARIFRDQINALEEQLSPYRTFNTKAVTEIYVPKNSIYPKKSIAAILGFLFGVMIVGTWIFIRDKELRDAFNYSFQETA